MKKAAPITGERRGRGGAKSPLSAALCLALGMLLAGGGCAGDPGANALPFRGSTDPGVDQEALASAQRAFRVSFHHSDYYSLMSPRAESSCAGDARTYYDAFKLSSDLTGPAPLAEDKYEPEATIRPAFIKNVSVDLTDANSASALNLAVNCSYKAGKGVPQASNCATFDYGALGGIATGMGGSLLIVGGLGSSAGASLSCNRDSASVCYSSAHALSIQAKGASGPTTDWLNVAGTTAATSPPGLVGASMAYSQDARVALLFGGLTGSGSSLRSSDTNWLFNTQSQLWESVPVETAADSALLKMLDGSTLTLFGKDPGPRSRFAYVASPGWALQGMSNDGDLARPNIDLTDRLLIMGGESSGRTALTDLHKFNPTYGPDWIDGNRTSGIPQIAPNLTQWLDSYHTQVLSNSSSATQYQPDYPPRIGFDPESKPSKGMNVAYAGLVNTSAQADGLRTLPATLLAIGGFDATQAINTPATGDPTCDSLTRCGTAFVAKKGSDASTGDYSAPANKPGGSPAAPVAWTEVEELAPGPTVPWYGGASLLPGFDLSVNELLFFGGSSCSDYLTNSTATSCSFANPGFYWRLGAAPVHANTSTISAIAGIAGAFPTNAGMAAARGLDGANNVIVVAWGGMRTAGNTDPTGRIHFFYNDAGTRTWGSKEPTNPLVAPIPVGEASLVFSHVTRKFYLFGGYSPAPFHHSADTWELTVTGSCAGAACTFTWRQLNGTGGKLTCSPSCPDARHGHRMAEANYYNRNPAGTGAGGATGESACSELAPCSFGIFMEGGSGGATPYLSDRWLFDPTANDGDGHWQRMGDLPPRAGAAMAAVDYQSIDTGKTVRRAILFGGETGMQNPEVAAPDRYFVPPTLGDTLMFDYDKRTWNRVNLLGKGYFTDAPVPGTSTPETLAYASPPVTANEKDRREAYSATYRAQDIGLSPPPLAGAVMIVRTMSGPTLSPTAPSEKLRIPEIYLFGGRTKDGELHQLTSVYKFCTGSTGEAPRHVVGEANDRGHCDAYDAATNPLSPSPSSKYEGRWLRKSPSAPVGASVVDSPATYLGAGTYDPVHDRLVLVGGRSSATAVTDVDSLGFQNSESGYLTSVFEYVPPSVAQDGSGSEAANGKWEVIPACTGSLLPRARYGHTLNFDLGTQSLVLVGGYGAGDVALTATGTASDGRTTTIPDLWLGKRIDSGATPCYSWTRVTTYNADTPASVPPASPMARGASIYVPTSGFNTGYYTMFDYACTNQGPVATTDPQTSRLLAGGASIDLDRSALEPGENLLLNLTYLPMGLENQRPDTVPLTQSESAYFKIHLVKTGMGPDLLRQIYQPRYFTFSAPELYPRIVETLTVLAPPTGQIREDQILIPLSLDPLIDRIQIERYSGTGILIGASLYRMGVKR